MVVIIAISAAIVIPLATRQLRDNQVHRAAKELATVYRNSRMLAMARGGAVVVRFDAGVVTVREGILDNATGDAACQQLPATSCNRGGSSITAWNDGQAGNEVVSTLSGANFAGSSDIPIGITADGGGALVDVCYTPMGRTMRRNGSSTARFAPMAGPLVLRVRRGTSGVSLARIVTVLPGGAARITTAELQ